ncbi:N-6 DNA methylase [Sulfitobacter geojensis]|uniref:site-specific DNA-methyltransferase (adenine-specific) n=3 Tax=Sulfitobacter geojensis TaxID=1342299 RepID=A0AAE3B8D3_9RHOB|nr:N-6 DNA methylase [Sulfitobacter geojensis]MBM1691599.1 N-6 DNA methylase [Sulfitobacter geojensis]MBM1695654.1 N-6 DNA methylase [Sulfitobacter geojensis]MBM1707806.1 N-6 DNA methylase [Sulfitobacter geojensis]MBM1711867.1 N-6 DNA methylase [Sulfitobacter geojensis]MBM1715934.1 N-6 DNA methylase [Sulfitobacter geojensis]
MAQHADGLGRDAAIAAFKKTFRELAPYKHRYEVFKDFVTMAACSLHNSIHKEPAREEEYLRIIAGYKKPDQEAFPKLMGLLIAALDEEPRDILGPLYMELEIANKDAGQFFTPPELSELMANLIFGDALSRLETQPFITAGEPACGAGGMILALVKVMIAQGYNPSQHLWVQCIDVDRMAALMCYTQLSLWNVPAEIIVGNTLSWDIREVWYTPAHHMGLWKYRLHRIENSTEVEISATEGPVHKAPPPEPSTPLTSRTPEPPAVKPSQLGFDF